MVKTPKTYWKSLKYRDGKIVSDYDGSEWTVGVYRTNPYPVVKECEGLNCCRHIVDAMGYVWCDVLAAVTIRGHTIVGDDKITAQKMKLLRAWRWAEEDSVALAIYAAELVIEYYEKTYPNDNRPRTAIEAAKEYLQNSTPATYAAADATYAAARAAIRTTQPGLSCARTSAGSTGAPGGSQEMKNNAYQPGQHTA